MKTMIFAFPVEDPHMEKTTHHRITELGMIHQAELFRGPDHESPEGIVIVKIFQLVVELLLSGGASRQDGER